MLSRTLKRKPKHQVSVLVPKVELGNERGSQSMKLVVRKDDKPLAEFDIDRGGLEFRPYFKKKRRRMSWSELVELLWKNSKSTTTLATASKKTTSAAALPVPAGTLIAGAFQMALRGTTRDALKAYAEKSGCGFQRFISDFRRSPWRGFTWKFWENENGQIKITDLRRVAAPANAKE